jgi:hypothetical protein
VQDDYPIDLAGHILSDDLFVTRSKMLSIRKVGGNDGTVFCGAG